MRRDFSPQLWVTPAVAAGIAVGSVITHLAPVEPFGQSTGLLTGAGLVLLVAIVHRLIPRTRRQRDPQPSTLPLSTPLLKPRAQPRGARSNLLANLSHEIRNPMTAIVGYAELLLDEQDATPQQRREWLTTIHGGGQRLMELMNDILDMERIDAGAMPLRPRHCDIREMHDDVQRLFAGMAAGKGLALNVEVDRGVPDVIVADGIRLRQILANLLSNAIKFTRAGKVDVFTTVHRFGEALRLNIQVRDTGCGIAPELHDVLFEPFAQHETAIPAGGTGLGLSICRALAQMMDGEITFHTIPGAGSTFNVNVAVESARTDPLNESTPACAA